MSRLSLIGFTKPFVIMILLFTLFFICCGFAVAQLETNKTRGMMLCSGNRMIHDAVAVVDQTRLIWKSELPITVAHCGELTFESIRLFREMNVSVLDICAGKKDQMILGMDNAFAHNRLRSWFCKTAALILSPYEETMIADLDVIWFKKPDVLFDSPAYKSTGSLFFRDRLTHASDKPDRSNKVFQNIMEEFIGIEGHFNMTPKLAEEQLNKNGFNFFWMNLADRSKGSYDNFQDSSVILLDRSTHPKTLDVLTRLLPNFNLGYGDKEIYWFATTIAQEPFSFEPFFCSTYGDCGGLMTHYDPNDEGDAAKAGAMYINAEWYLSKIHVLGLQIEEIIANPVIVKTATNFNNLYSGVDGKCSCRTDNFGCETVPDNVNILILRAQWERLSRSKPSCITILKSTVSIINLMLKNMIDDHVCGKYGCALWPIVVNTSSLHPSTVCVPISFNITGPDLSLAILPEILLIPPVIKDNTLAKGSQTHDVYIIKDGLAHAIPNAKTFLGNNWDFDDVKSFPQITFDLYPKGEPIPEIIDEEKKDDEKKKEKDKKNIED